MARPTDTDIEAEVLHYEDLRDQGLRQIGLTLEEASTTFLDPYSVVEYIGIVDEGSKTRFYFLVGAMAFELRAAELRWALTGEE